MATLICWSYYQIFDIGVSLYCGDVVFDYVGLSKYIRLATKLPPFFNFLTGLIKNKQLINNMFSIVVCNLLNVEQDFQYTVGINQPVLTKNIHPTKVSVLQQY